MTRALVTGAQGFVGSRVVARLSELGVEVTRAQRPHAAPLQALPGQTVTLEASASQAQLDAAVGGVDVVVHLAAAVHDVSRRTTSSEFTRVNRDYTLALAAAAARAGVRRFVFASTVKVHGDGTGSNEALKEDSPVQPQGDYAESKWQAEQGLRRIAAETTLEALIVRPPLVYGPGVRANFLSLMRAVQRRVPFPFAGLKNRRSLVYVENLADALATLALREGRISGPGTYLVSDQEDLSTPELIRRIASALGVRPLLVNVPEPMLRAGLRMIGRQDAAVRLLGSLRVDAGRLEHDCAWLPRFGVEEGLQQTATWLRTQ